MKEIKFVFGFLVVILLAFPLILAQEDLELNEENEKQMLSFAFQQGAQVRLDQLERNIYRNIVSGEKVIEYINNFNDSINVSSLQYYLDELNLVRQEVVSYNLSEDNQENVKKFLEFKHLSITLTKEFRDEARSLLHENEISTLREIVNETIRDNENLKQKDQLIKKKIRSHNENVTGNMMNKLNLSNEDFINQIRNGSFDPKEIRDQVVNRVRQMQEDKQIGMFNQMKEEAMKNRINVRSSFEENINSIRDQVNNRIENKSSKISENKNSRGGRK